MRLIFQIISGLSLVATLLLAVLFFADQLTLVTTQTGLLIATITWFVATPLWMGRPSGG